MFQTPPVVGGLGGFNTVSTCFNRVSMLFCDPIFHGNNPQMANMERCPNQAVPVDLCERRGVFGGALDSGHDRSLASKAVKLTFFWGFGYSRSI